MSDDKWLPLPPSPCAGCGAPHDASLAPDGEYIPQPGDSSLCVYCGTVAVYGDDLRLRRPTPVELSEILSDPEVAEAIKLWQAGWRPPHMAPRGSWES